VIVDCAHYRDGRRQHDGPMELDRAATACKGTDAGFVWLGLFEPSVEELQKVQPRFGLHDRVHRIGRPSLMSASSCARSSATSMTT